ncbi:MAG: peptidoglycan DD-metalloendopeptidase family protein [Clostridia bacterium]|nr:peptidoglycan DD-metalloendopeptidase family protein [Clostridia bacterium]
MKKICRMVSLLLALLAAVSVFTVIPGAAVTNDAIKAKQNEISALQNLLKQKKNASESARNRIEEIKSEIEKTEELKNDLIEKIAELNDEITTTQELVEAYAELIALKEEEIRETEEDLVTQENSIVEFLRYDYEAGSSDFKTVEFLLHSASLSDFLSNIHYIGTLMDYQEHLIQNLENTITKHESQLYDLNVFKSEKEEYAKQLDIQLAEAEELKIQKLEYIIKLEADQLEYEAVLETSEEAEKALNEQIARAKEEEAALIKTEEERQRKLEEERKRKEEEERKKREAEEAARRAREEAQQAAADQEAAARARQAELNAAAYGNGGYLWPLPMNSFRITGWFGYEPSPLSSGIRFHKAVDLGAARGTNIYASRSGKVITAKYSSSYGNYVMILHDDGYTTLYAHASKLLVKVGDKVKQGDVIALVGTTGDSTGNHLHFEIIQEDGRTREDPMLYFKKIYELRKNDSPRYDNLNNPRRTTYKV